MPIYAYRCASCGHAKDVLQKLSDPPLTVCPACGASAFAKQVTAAGFQLKGSGWYATDFKSGNGAKKPDSGEGGKTDAGKIEAGTPETGKSEPGKGGESSAPAKSGESGTAAKASDPGSTSTSSGSTPAGGSAAAKAAGGGAGSGG